MKVKKIRQESIEEVMDLAGLFGIIFIAIIWSRFDFALLGYVLFFCLIKYIRMGFRNLIKRSLREVIREILEERKQD